MGDEERMDDIEEEGVVSDQGSGSSGGGGSSDVSKIIKILIYIVCIILVIFLVFGISFVVAKYVQEKKYQQDQDIVVAPAPPPFQRFALPSFAISTKDDEQHFAKITVVLAYEDNIELNTELVKRTAQIQDLINTVMASRYFKDLKSLEGKIELKSDIKAHINKILITGKLKEVYFTEYVVN